MCLCVWAVIFSDVMEEFTVYATSTALTNLLYLMHLIHYDDKSNKFHLVSSETCFSVVPYSYHHCKPSSYLNRVNNLHYPFLTHNLYIFKLAVTFSIQQFTIQVANYHSPRPRPPGAPTLRTLTLLDRLWLPTFLHLKFSPQG